ncbi:MAG: hypothetical protein QOJ12_2494 [Thermoleophilales bacterium]|jgi:hypothetical protein|nr:hypothetical protein [Thermoleophilales bacterium]
MDSLRTEVCIGRAGLLVGLALAALSVTGWTMPAGDSPAGMRVTLDVAPTGDLGVSPAGTVLRSENLQRGQAVDGTFVVTNQTGRPLTVRARAIFPSPDLGALVELRLATGGRALVDGRLANDRASSLVLEIPAGGRRRVHAEVAVPADGRGYEFRVADLRLELRTEPVR